MLQNKLPLLLIWAWGEFHTSLVKGSRNDIALWANCEIILLIDQFYDSYICSNLERLPLRKFMPKQLWCNLVFLSSEFNNENIRTVPINIVAWQEEPLAACYFHLWMLSSIKISIKWKNWLVSSSKKLCFYK